MRVLCAYVRAYARLWDIQWNLSTDTPEILLTYVLISSLHADTSLFRKADTFFGPTSVVTVQNLLDNADVCLMDNINSKFLRLPESVRTRGDARLLRKSTHPTLPDPMPQRYMLLNVAPG